MANGAVLIEYRLAWRILDTLGFDEFRALRGRSREVQFFADLIS
jgi:hypothetical protein